jgi:HAD superfamily hydrolase (TIGR01509 family)
VERVLVRALVFDFDGLILDTETCEYSSIAEEFASHGVELPLDEWLDTIGRADHRHWYDWLEEVVGRSLDRDEIIDRRRARHHELIAAQEVRDGVVELLDSARRASLAITVASSSPTMWVEGHLERIGLREYFHAVRCREHVAQAKPAPDLFLAAVDAVGVEPAAAIAFEDSHHGSMAAKAAGLFTVVVPNDLTRTQSFDHADLLLESLADFDLDTYVGAGA